MTTQSVDDIRADIAFLKDVVEGGPIAPLRGGLILLVVGLIFGVAGLVGFAGDTRLIALPQAVEFWLPFACMVAAFVLIAAIHALTPSPPKTPANRAMDTVWSGVGLGICALVVSGFGALHALHTGLVFALFTPFVLALYGAAWMVSFAVTRAAYQRLIALGCYGAAIVAGFVAGSPYVGLVLAGAMFAFAAAPGAFLISQARR